MNLIGVFRCAKAAAPALKAARGAIVSTASIAGLGTPGSSLAYGATTAGVVNLTQNLARALSPEVRVNAVAPGAVDSTWMIEWTPEQRQQSIEQAKLKRRCTTDDIAEVILFLGFGAAMGGSVEQPSLNPRASLRLGRRSAKPAAQRGGGMAGRRHSDGGARRCARRRAGLL